MRQLPAERTEAAFPDGKPAFTAQQAQIEANRCLYCSDAPCVAACPTAIDIPSFIRKIATGNVWGSARTIFDANILGTSCARVCPVEVLCVGACVHHAQGVPPIQIGRLQRFSTDAALGAGWRYAERGPDSGKRVALVGAGPASLSCAHELAVLGHRAVVLEKRDQVGGLNTTGVAPYKMKADRAVEEAEWILGIGGIEVRTVAEVDDFAALEREYDAVFLGLGLGADTPLGVPGEDLPGVVGAVEWIERMKGGPVDLAGVRTALVVGGGNTAMDCVRELALLGVPDVRLVYRGDAATMPGYAHEWEGAKKAGARAEWNTQPVAFAGEGRVRAARCQRTRDRRPVAGTDFEIPADLVLIAIGQARLGELLRGLDGVEVDRGRIVTDERGATGRPGWFAGGDCANGGKEVVNAAAEGKRAARAIDGWLKGGARA